MRFDGLLILIIPSPFYEDDLPRDHDSLLSDVFSSKIPIRVGSLEQDPNLKGRVNHRFPSSEPVQIDRRQSTARWIPLGIRAS